MKDDTQKPTWRVSIGHIYTVIDCVICSARLFVEMVENAPENQYSCPICGSNNEWFHLTEESR